MSMKTRKIRMVDLEMAKAYVTELCGGYDTVKRCENRLVSFGLTENQYVKGVSSINKFWPGSELKTSKTTGISLNFFIDLIAEPDFRKRIELTMREPYGLDGKLTGEAFYTISLLDDL